MGSPKLRGIAVLAASIAITTTGGRAAQPALPLSPFFSDSGLISLSVDAVGTNDPAGAPVRVQKNAGATVRRAFLFAASTGFSGYEPVDGDVTLDGSAVTWDPAYTINNQIASINVAADVTALVKPKVDAAPAGIVTFIVAEGARTLSIDGEILAVILDDPTVTVAGSVTLLYGAQSTTGDTFHTALADPADKTDPNFALNLSLGISYGFQPSGQFSTLDVNGARLTSSAGGHDDGNPVNGALVTVGGVGDLNDNPPDALANDSNCIGVSGPAPRCDDELYNLLSFVNDGDTRLTFSTTNPSNDDNILFAALDVRSGAALIGAGVVLSPTAATNNTGQPHQLTATVQDANGNPIPGVTVDFQVTAGPNAAINGTGVTNSGGAAQFTYTSSAVGTDHIVSRFTDPRGNVHTSNEATKTWVSASFTCPLSQGYWKNHPDAWPLYSLTLGTPTYTQLELLNILETPVRSGSGSGADASLILAHQLIAAKLNIAKGSDPAPVTTTIITADSLLTGVSGKLPYGTKPGSVLGQHMVGTGATLDQYNNGALTPVSCIP